MNFANQALYGDTELADIYARAAHADTVYDEVETIKLTAFLRQIINIWVAVEMAHVNGMANQETYNVIFDNSKEIIDGFPQLRPILRQLLDTYPALSGTKLFEYIDTSLKEHSD